MTKFPSKNQYHILRLTSPPYTPPRHHKVSGFSGHYWAQHCVCLCSWVILAIAHCSPPTNRTFWHFDGNICSARLSFRKNVTKTSKIKNVFYANSEHVMMHILVGIKVTLRNHLSQPFKSCCLLIPALHPPKGASLINPEHVVASLAINLAGGNILLKFACIKQAGTKRKEQSEARSRFPDKCGHSGTWYWIQPSKFSESTVKWFKG